MPQKKLYDLIRTDAADAVLDEASLILGLISSDIDVTPVSTAYMNVIRLYEGAYPGYQACNTQFHDLRHSIETFLAMARLIHGAVVEGNVFDHDHIVIGMIASIMHDAGYIQEEFDMEGTGAKHTGTHVRRSMDFFERYAIENKFSEALVAAGRVMILCTDLAVDIKAVAFPSTQAERLGKMLGAADLLAQMADRTYLEKLLFLYQEFSEADIGGYESEMDLLTKTVTFYDVISHRFSSVLDNADQYMKSHFAVRWNINTDLYQEAVAKQKKYLLRSLQAASDPRTWLRRDFNGVCMRLYRQHQKRKK